ncbi:hypothetical protein [Roseateles aquatilis]|uniref:hypothetical protein n=1 Tax=Roseateles aquatilis TaxID=431061 RepID=UPI0011311415|nr:hypothetical protein [Roseateles aquatilis]
MHLADLALNRGVASVAVPVTAEPDARTAAPHRSLVERLLGGELSVTGASPCHGELSIKTRPRPEQSRNVSGVIDVIVEGEGGLRYVRTLSVHALPLNGPRQFAERLRSALVLGARYRSEPVRSGLGKPPHCAGSAEPVAGVAVPGVALIHDLGAESLGPCIAAVDRLRAGRSSRRAVGAAAAAVEKANRPRLPPPPRDPRRDWRAPVVVPIGPVLIAPIKPDRLR